MRKDKEKLRRPADGEDDVEKRENDINDDLAAAFIVIDPFDWFGD